MDDRVGLGAVFGGVEAAASACDNRGMLFVPVRRTVTFDHDGDHLVGDLFLPPAASAAGPVPAVILVAGSGAGVRAWEDYGHRFAAVGLAAYAYDKPGTGESSGDWLRQTLEDRADELLAAADALAVEPGIDGRRIGLFGGSQGGWVAPLAASRSASIRAVAMFSGPGSASLRTRSTRSPSAAQPKATRRRRWPTPSLSSAGS
ncbi:MAG: alpha/beta hydrolase [Chloroflexi bacterium]|nr:alpha/beta hydrolase [Chloroflexota bacterium]